MVDEDYYRYSTQSPFISFVPFPAHSWDGKTVKEWIAEKSIQVWKFIESESRFNYHPVLTIFTSEEAIAYIKTFLFSDQIVGINEQILSCYKITIRLLSSYNTGYNEIMQNALNYKTCDDIKRRIDDILDVIHKLDVEFHSLVDSLHDNDCRLFNDFFRRKTQSDPRLNERDVNYKEIFQDWLLYIQARICRLKQTSNREYTQIGTLIDEIQQKFGCYTPPGFWVAAKSSGRYNSILRQLGVPTGVELFDLPCVFIYPFMIERWNTSIPNPSRIYFPLFTDVQLVELVLLVIIHEHTHAMLRHGVPKTPSPSDVAQWCNPERQDEHDLIRKKLHWLNEGMAMHFEEKYLHNLQIPNFDVSGILDELDKYIDPSRALGDWPYSGYRIVKNFLKDGNNTVEKLVTNWKKDPGKLSGKFKPFLNGFTL